MLIRYAVAALTCALLASPALADFEEGALAYRKGDFPAALKELEPLVAQGDAAAQFLAGSAYANAKPPLQDFAQAEKLLRAAAAQGHIKAMVSLGELFLLYKQPADGKQAFEWYKMAAEHCDSEGQFWMGLGHFEGKSLAKDLPSAWMWFTLASLRGHLLAAATQHSLRDKFSDADVAAGTQRVRQWHCQ
ncbi:MAG: tetratricopeptide repeat protein [Burkholderiales bacterium]